MLPQGQVYKTTPFTATLHLLFLFPAGDTTHVCLTQDHDLQDKYTQSIHNRKYILVHFTVISQY